MPGYESQNVYIIGPQCTGKTTLVNALESELTRTTQYEDLSQISKPIVIREVARTVLKEKQFSREDITTSPSRALMLQQHILNAQFYAEQAISAHSDASEWYISDRSGLDPIVYALLFVGVDAAEELLATEAWKELEKRMKEGIVVLCESGCGWLEDDGTRLMPTDLEDWKRIDVGFQKLLHARQINYVTLAKDVVSLTERVKFVVDQMQIRR